MKNSPTWDVKANPVTDLWLLATIDLWNNNRFMIITIDNDIFEDPIGN